MEVITMESQAFKELLSQLQQIKAGLEAQRKSPSDPLFDNNEVCKLLKVSKRTLQNYRDNGDLSFSQVGAKLLYRTSDIDDFLKRNYKKAFHAKP
ncbi:MAG: helix-turn-helix domain-containing protein [Chitinophagales bacterium]